MSSKTFYSYFRENMEGLGLIAPESLFGSIGVAVGTIGTLAKAMDKIGPGATMRTVVLCGAVGAGGSRAALAISRLCLFAGACIASFYIGACIGSLMVASQRKMFEIKPHHISHALTRYKIHKPKNINEIYQHKQLFNRA